MSNLGSVLARVAALVGGAVAGALLAEWFDKQLSEQAQVKSEFDRTRYAQGLAPRAPQAPTTEDKIYREKPYEED